MHEISSSINRFISSFLHLMSNVSSISRRILIRSIIKRSQHLFYIDKQYYKSSIDQKASLWFIHFGHKLTEKYFTAIITVVSCFSRRNTFGEHMVTSQAETASHKPSYEQQHYAPYISDNKEICTKCAPPTISMMEINFVLQMMHQNIKNCYFLYKPSHILQLSDSNPRILNYW